MHLWLGQAARHDAQDQAPRRCSCRWRIFAEPYRLQPDPNPEIGCRLGKLPRRSHRYVEPNIQITRERLHTGTAKLQIFRFFRRLLDDRTFLLRKRYFWWGGTFDDESI